MDNSRVKGEALAVAKRLAAAVMVSRKRCMTVALADAKRFSDVQAEVPICFRAAGPYILVRPSDGQPSSHIEGNWMHEIAGIAARFECSVAPNR